MRRPSSQRQRGFTLIEALVAIGLAVMVVGVVAFSVTQVQRSIEDLRNRTTLAVNTDNAFSQIERDLAHMVRDAFNTPAPFTSMSPAPVPLAMNSTNNAPVTGDPTTTPPVPRYGDSLKIFTITPAGQRAYVEYCLSGSSDTSPGFIPNPGGGLYTAALQRHVLGIANPGDTQVALESTPSTWTPPGSGTLPTAFYAAKPMSIGPSANPMIIETPITLVNNVISFRIAYIPAGGTTFVGAVSSQPLNFFLPTGSLKVQNYMANAASSADAALLTAVPVGYPLNIAVSGVTGSGQFIEPTANFVVRRWSGGTSSAVSQVMLSDHVNVSSSIAFNNDGPPPTQTVQARAFTPPAVIGVTLTLRYGLGPNGSIMTLRREIPVSRN